MEAHKKVSKRTSLLAAGGYSILLLFWIRKNAVSFCSSRKTDQKDGSILLPFALK